jgi:hypothetical protein
MLGLLDQETSQAELEALEREPRPPVKKAPKQKTGKEPPRDECGRFTNPKKKGKNASSSR